ncbi:hypothetical protein IWQ61_003627 [Dispira simplex]|nr:hypothetical protein IWQ61_003627 [Dispira simplex]
MRASAKKQLYEYAVQLDMRVVSQWTDECTHLVMKDLAMTQRALLALVHGVHIVSDRWCGRLATDPSVRKRLETQGELIAVRDYFPQPSAMSGTAGNPLTRYLFHVDLWQRQTVRRNLFSGYGFILSSLAQCQRLKVIVEAAGGVVCYPVGETVTQGNSHEGDAENYSLKQVMEAIIHGMANHIDSLQWCLVSLDSPTKTDSLVVTPDKANDLWERIQR